jgi:hypothetical protein
MNGWISLALVASIVWIVGAWFWADRQVAAIDAEIRAESYQDCSQYSEPHLVDNCEKRNELTRAMASSEYYAGELSDLKPILFTLALLPLLATWLGGIAVQWIRSRFKKGSVQ